MFKVGEVVATYSISSPTMRFYNLLDLEKITNISNKYIYTKTLNPDSRSGFKSTFKYNKNTLELDEKFYTGLPIKYYMRKLTTVELIKLCLT